MNTYGSTLVVKSSMKTSEKNFTTNLQQYRVLLRTVPQMPLQIEEPREA